MPQSNLLELTYFDPKAQVRLTTYADTIITEPNGREESLAAVRFGGYPEMVRAMSDAIYGGGSIDLIQNGNTFQLKSKPKSYQRQLAHDGAYATGHLVDGVVDGVQAVLLGAQSQIHLALGGAELAVHTPGQIVLGGSLHVGFQLLAQHLGKLSGVLGLFEGGLLPVQGCTCASFHMEYSDKSCTRNYTFSGGNNMGKQNDAGVFQLESGLWAFRYTFTRDGKRISKQGSKDESGCPLKTKRAAIKARQMAVDNEQNARKPKPTVRKTVAEVYQEYCEKGRSGKAYNTIRKQESLWVNHLCAAFGKRYIDEISAAEVVDYLTELYYNRGLSYRYVESFLKMFYLIFGQAYSRNYLAVDNYNKLCTNKDTKIHMPKLKTDDDIDIVAFSREELVILDDYFRGTNAETAYMLGRFCGLRINECFGLKWENVDVERGTILIDRQMQYQDGLIKLVPLKTHNARRTIYMCDKLKAYFQELARRRSEDEIQFAALRSQNQRLIEDLGGKQIFSTELVNCLPNGKIQTVNSMKYPTREIKARFHIDFKYHHLRHTYGTLMAEMNTPTHLLCNQMGHGNIQVTQRYYIAVSKSGVNILQGNLNML